MFCHKLYFEAIIYLVWQWYQLSWLSWGRILKSDKYANNDDDDDNRVDYNDGDQRWMMTIVKSFLLFLPLSLFSRAPLGLSINGLHIVRRKRNIFTDFWELSSLSPPWLPTLSRLELLNLKVAHPQIFHRRLSLALRSKILFRAAESCYTEPYYKLPP